MYTYNTNRRQSPSTDWKDAEPQHREWTRPTKRRAKAQKQNSHRATPSVLCPFPILSVSFFCVDEYAQGSTFGEFLAQGGLKRWTKACFDVLPNEGCWHRDREGLGPKGHRGCGPEPHPKGGGVYLVSCIIQYASPELLG